MHEHENQLSSHNSCNFYARLLALHCQLFNSPISNHRYIGQCLASCNRIEWTEFQKHANKSTLEIRKSILLHSWNRTWTMVQGHHNILGSLNRGICLDHWESSCIGLVLCLDLWGHIFVVICVCLVLCLGLINALPRTL